MLRAFAALNPLSCCLFLVVPFRFSTFLGEGRLVLPFRLAILVFRCTFTAGTNGIRDIRYASKLSGRQNLGNGRTIREETAGRVAPPTANVNEHVELKGCIITAVSFTHVTLLAIRYALASDKAFSF